MDISYTTGGAGLLTALVSLQQVWGVEFHTAVQNAHRVITAHVKQHGQRGVDLEEVVKLMLAVAPPPR